MKTIFLDIGAYIGDTIPIALEYGIFDVIHAFEPVKELYPIIESNINDDKVILHKYGLLDSDCEKTIYCSGTEGGSIFKDKDQRGKVGPPVKCKFKKASDWFKNNISDDDNVYVKLNVEGAEIAILNDLIDNKQYYKINNVLICFDILKVPGGNKLFKGMINKFKKFNIHNYSITGNIKGKVRSTGIKATINNMIKYWLDGSV